MSALAARLRERAAALTVEQALGWLPWSACAAGAVSLAIIGAHSVLQRRTDVSQAALAWTLIAFVVAAVLASAPAGAFQPRRRGDGIGPVAWALALNAGVLLTVAAVYSAVWQTGWDAVTGWRTYPYLNKRWVAALYGSAWLTFLVLPVWIDRWLRGPAALNHDLTLPTDAGRPRRWWLPAIDVVLLLAAVWFLAGPPWNIATHHRVIDFHEQVHLGALQAVDKGYTPYVGPASTQYGPGAQLAIYSYMQWTNRFDIVGFREAFVFIHLVCVAAFALLARAHAGARTAWLILLIGVICSPIRFFAFGADGSPGETFGWGNAGRYIAALLVVPAGGILVTRPVPYTRAAALGLGAGWGLLAWFSQENLASVVIAGALLTLVLIGTQSTTWRNVASVAVPLGVGFAIVWIPLLAWYLSRGALGQFLGNYLILPQAVAAGYTNTWFAGEPGDVFRRAFQMTPVLAILVAVATVWDVRAWRVRRPLDCDRVRLLSFVCALAASFTGALYRSDALHTLNTFLALPFVMVLAFRDLPAWIASTTIGRATTRVAIAAIALWVYPLTPQLTQIYDWIVFPAAQKYSVAAPEPAAAAGVAFARATVTLSDEPSVAGEGTGPMRQFLTDASALHELVGSRRTFIESAGPYFSGLVYFMADLTPAPYLYDRETMILNDRRQAEAWAHFQRHVDQVECVIASTEGSFEARAFLSANPSARMHTRRLGETSVMVIMNGEAAAP